MLRRGNVNSRFRRKSCPNSVDFRLELTRHFHANLTRLIVAWRDYLSVDKSVVSGGLTPLDLVLRLDSCRIELWLKRQDSLPVSTMWQ